MTDLKLKYIKRYRDRHGRMHYYVRRRPAKDVPLPGAPGDPEFHEAYERALASLGIAPSAGAARTRPGSVAEAIVGFYHSPKFKALKPNTQGYYRGDLEKLKAKIGGKQITGITFDMLQQALDDRAAHPDAAKQWLIHVRAVLRFALRKKMIAVDPSIGVERPEKKNKDGHKEWPVEYIERFRSHFPLGTMPRLAIELLYGTGQRRSDVVRMDRTHLTTGNTTGNIKITQFKKPHAEVNNPILPELKDALDAMASHTLASVSRRFLLNEHGQPFTADSFTDWFVDRAAEAGIPKGYSPHGLRKSSASRLAEAGATTHELMSWHGWVNITEAERYTKKANRKRMSGNAAAKLAPPADSN